MEANPAHSWDGRTAGGPDTAGLQVLSCLCEAVPSHLPGFAESLEEVFQWDDSTGIECSLLCTDLMNPDGPDCKLGEPCRDCLKEKWWLTWSR